MSFFKKLLGKKTPEVNIPEEKTQSTKLIADYAPCSSEEELFEKYCGISFEKQIDFNAFLAGYEAMNVDMREGTIQFGDDVFAIQIIGTYAYEPQSWLWAWDNERSNISKELLEQVMSLKNYGEVNNIELLTSPSFEMPQSDLDLIGMITAGMLNADAYYMADYGQGTMLITLTDDRIKKFRNDSTSRILTVFPQVISEYELNHKNAFTQYFFAKGYEVVESGNALIGTRGDSTIRAEFDGLSRITAMKTM